MQHLTACKLPLQAEVRGVMLASVASTLTQPAALLMLQTNLPENLLLLVLTTGTRMCAVR